MKIGVVIVNYNGEKFQNDCIRSILNSSYDDFLIFIVDNCSTDHSMEKLNEFNDERIIKIFEDENKGVAEGNNIGIKASIKHGCNATLLLNNDTEIQINTLEILAERLREYSVVTPEIRYWNSSKIWYLGGSFDKMRGRQKDWNIGKDISELTDIHNFTCSYAPSCCLAIKNDVFKKIGYIDEKYFLYYDDTDFCLRMSKAMIQIYVTRDTYIFHKVSLSTGDGSPMQTYYLTRNRLYFLDKYKRYFYVFTKSLLMINLKIKILLKYKNYLYIKKGILDYKNKVFYKYKE